MGIATSTGVIRDFSGPYHVAEDSMTFGKPTKYWQLDYTKAKGGVQGWDSAVAEASEIYKGRKVSLLNIFLKPESIFLILKSFPIVIFIILILHSIIYVTIIVIHT